MFKNEHTRHPGNNHRMEHIAMTSSLGGFFSGGAKGITWPETPATPGGRTAVSGVIETVHPPEPIIDMVTQLPTDKMQVRIVLKTDERDPSDPEDDGRRTLYVKSWMRGAVGEALRKAGAKEPEPGGTLSVQFTHLEAPERPGLSPSKKFAATYSKPAVTGGYFATGVAQPAAAAPPAPAAPAAPAPVQQPVQQPYIPPAVASIIAKPDAISDVAWAAMDDATKATVAATMSAAAAPPY